VARTRKKVGRQRFHVGNLRGEKAGHEIPRSKWENENDAGGDKKWRAKIILFGAVLSGERKGGRGSSRACWIDWDHFRDTGGGAFSQSDLTKPKIGKLGRREGRRNERGNIAYRGSVSGGKFTEQPGGERGGV